MDRAFSENTEQRFKAYGWQVLRVEDGNDVDAIRQAIKEAQQNQDQPTLIEVKTIIGYGSPNKSASSASHGSPLGADEVKLTKEAYKWNHEDFYVSDEVYADFKEKIVTDGSKKRICME